ncbi:MAG: paraquat-inducible protein A [Rhodospirillales bacterium]|nr:paraquat-inducible protein A [Rhodospirillales bacterium]
MPPSFGSGNRHGRGVPVLVAAALICLGLGLTLPIMEVRNFWIFHGSYSILDGISMLIDQGDVLIAAIVVAFSVAAPAGKNLALLLLWWRWRGGKPVPRHLPSLLDAIGKWSMLDVFVVALLVFAAKTRAFADASVTPAIVPFMISIALTMYCSRKMRLALAEQAAGGGAASRSPRP